jgi:hypothetical protein
MGVMANLQFLALDAFRKSRLVVFLNGKDAPCSIFSNSKIFNRAKEPAPEIAIDYWRLPPDAKLLDVIYAVRSDETTHRFVNHRRVKNIYHNLCFVQPVV